MKPLSASVIVLAAAILIASGGHMRNPDAASLAIYTGILIGFGGLITWVVAFFKEKWKGQKVTRDDASKRRHGAGSTMPLVVRAFIAALQAAMPLILVTQGCAFACPGLFPFGPLGL